MESVFMSASKHKLATLFVMLLATLSSALASASPATTLSASSLVQSASDGPAQEASAVRDDAQALLRASYQACIDRSDGVTVKMQECIAIEYTYHDDKLNRVYRYLRTTLDQSAANTLRDEQRAWLKRMDAECTRNIKEGGQAARLSANDCRVGRTAQRVAELEAIAAASKLTASSEATADGAVGTDGGLVLTLGGSTLSIRADACRSIGAELQHCADGVEISIANAAGRSRLRLPTLYVNARATAYRGALTRPADQAGRSIVLADIDRNGRDDIAVWTGIRGANGAASYDVYLASGKGYALNRELSVLTVGKNGLFVLDGSRLVTTSKSGCCIHSVQTYALRSGKPVLIEETVKDATQNAAEPKVTTRRLVDGKMRVVDR
jgi:uncharacterized protein YecT (DUF1311 family)